MNIRLAIAVAAAGISLLAACSQAVPAETGAFYDVRTAHQTSIRFPSASGGEPMPEPPPNVFLRVSYPAASGAHSAYLSPDPGDARRHPAIVWMTGGESNTVGDVWSPQGRDNDQSASAYREAGIIMMFPSLRGGNDNPGQVEGMYGEVDDVIAAAQYLARQPYVDPERVYLGGHSTGGTLVLLTAEASDMFRAVFAFGPVSDARLYGRDFIPVDFSRLPPWEHRLRAPGLWLNSIRDRTYVIEGAIDGNADELQRMRAANANPLVTFIRVPGATHFSVLAPANEVIAQAILTDAGEPVGLNLTEERITAALGSAK